MEIQRLGRGDGDRLRDVRLRALADAPYAFSSSLDRESVLDAAFWESRAAESEAGVDGVVFVALEGRRAVGMAGGFFAERDLRDTATLWGMWVDPVARRRGVAESLAEAVARWAGDSGAGHVRLAVTDCELSDPAARLYEKLGFADTGEREPLEWNAALITRVLCRPA